MVRPRLVEEGKPLSSTSPLIGGPRRADTTDDEDVMEHDDVDHAGHHYDSSLPPHHDSSRLPYQHNRREHQRPYYYDSSAPPGDRSRPSRPEQRAAEGGPESRGGAPPPPMTSSSSSLLRAVSRIPGGHRRHPHDHHHPGHPHATHSYRTVIGGGGENHRGGGNGDDNVDGTTRELMPRGSSDRPRENAAAPDRPPRSAAAAARSLGSTSWYDHGGVSYVPDDGGRRAAPGPTTASRTVRGPHPTHYEIGPRGVEKGHCGGSSRAAGDDHDHTMMDHEDVTGMGDAAAGGVGGAWLRGTRHEYAGSSLALEEPPARMEGVEDHSLPMPLVVMDGANVAYEYGGSASATGGDHKGIGKGSSGTADPKGILVACEYFVRQGARVKVVLPASWFRRKPNANDPNRSNAHMETDSQDLLVELRNRGLLVASPPADDDDAYAIALARRESSRLAQRCRDLDLGFGHHGTTINPSSSSSSLSVFPMATLGGAFVLSNDMFRDAQHRDPTLRTWLTTGNLAESAGRGGGATVTGRIGSSSLSLSSTTCPGRISYTFADVGALDDHGDPQLDFLPNPRHPLVQWIEERHRSNLR